MSVDEHMTSPDKLPRSAAWLAAVSVIAVVAFFVFVAPIAQDPAYHEFVDGRRLFAIPNFWNVASNLPFLFVGVYGFVFLWRYRMHVGESGLHRAWQVFFIGIVLTSFGSSYYHLAPGNATLAWDRLPMTIAFSGLFTIVIGEYLSVRAARHVLIPLLIAGAASVIYWAVTEANDAGDLRPYAVVQFLPMILTCAILIIYRRASDLTRYLWLMIATYAIAKFLEFFDAGVYGIFDFISGHSLKHVAASLVPLALLFALRARDRAAREACVNEQSGL